MSDLERYTDDELYIIMADLVSVQKNDPITYEAQAFILGEVIRIRRELLRRKPKDAA